MPNAIWKKYAVSAALIAGLGLSPLSLHAAGATPGEITLAMETRAKTVRYDDLDLTRTAEARTLHTRISRAAWSVCRDQRDIHNLHANKFYKQCVRRAVDAAIRDVGHPNLALVHEDRGPAIASR